MAGVIVVLVLVVGSCSLFYRLWGHTVAGDAGEAIPGVESKWEKMSKSKGNVLDPIAIIDKYGADAMRCAAPWRQGGTLGGGGGIGLASQSISWDSRFNRFRASVGRGVQHSATAALAMTCGKKKRIPSPKLTSA